MIRFTPGLAISVGVTVISDPHAVDGGVTTSSWKGRLTSWGDAILILRVSLTSTWPYALVQHERPVSEWAGPGDAVGKPLSSLGACAGHAGRLLWPWAVTATICFGNGDGWSG